MKPGFVKVEIHELMRKPYSCLYIVTHETLKSANNE